METLTKVPTSNNVEEANKKGSLNSQTIERWQIPSTPFTVITIGEKNFGVCGEYRVTNDYESRAEVEKELKEVSWNRLIQVYMILDELKKKDDFNQKLTEIKENNEN